MALGPQGADVGGLGYSEEEPAGCEGDLEGKSGASWVPCGAAEGVVGPFPEREGAGAGF